MSAQPPKKRPRSQLTARQAQFIDDVMTGVAPSTAAKNAPDLLRSSKIKAEIESARRWLTDATQIRRLDVVEGIIDGIEMARMQSDSGNVIKGWSEVGKILGHYAPEKKILELSLRDQRLKSKFESMTDEELLALQHGTTVEGTAERVDDGETAH